MAWYKHITNYHSDNPTLSRENVKEILVRKFSQINPPKPKPIQESVSYWKNIESADIDTLTDLKS